MRCLLFSDVLALRSWGGGAVLDAKFSEGKQKA